MGIQIFLKYFFYLNAECVTDLIIRCSVDPYLFENFNTVDGDTLTARFKAFKFPETNYVLFRGTIDVCLDKCSGVCLIATPLSFKLF